MKSHFTGLFQYNDWANQKLLICLQKNKIDDELILTLFQHILAAQNIWLERITHENYGENQLWAATPLLDLIQATHDSSDRWNNFLENYQMPNFEEVIAYSNTKDIPFETKLSDILIHVINHGTHHRGQIMRLLREKDIAPPQLDYIFFCREHVRS